MKPILAATLLAAFTATLFAAEENQGHKVRTPMAAVLTEMSGPEFEATFLGLMIHHHKAGEPMWTMAREKSKSETILALEKKTIPKEEREIEKMTAWLKEWHGKSPGDFQEPEESKQTMKRDMASLKASSGAEFDSTFAEKMAHHHMDAIEMAKLAKEKGSHSDLKKFAENLAEAQSADRQALLQIQKHHK